MTSPGPTVILGPRGQLGVGIAVLVGVALRVLALGRLGPQVDEAASVLAAIQTATHGVPRLPSGILYTQGLAQSYLLAPLGLVHGLGAGLTAPRMLSLVAGVGLLATAVALGRRTLGSRAAVVGFVALVSLDPSLVQWSGLVRPYALVACANLLVVLGFVDVIARGVRPANAAAVAAAFTLGVFSHLTAALVWPALALWVLAQPDRWRRDRWALLAGLLAAPAALQAINAVFAVSSRGKAVGLPVKFVGDHLIDPTHVVRPEIEGWRSLYDGGALEDLMPVFVALAIGWGIARPRPWTLAMTAAFAVPVAALSALVSEQQGRYLLTAAPLAWWLLVSAAESAWAEGGGRRLFAAGLVAAAAISTLSGLGYRWQDVTVDIDYHRAVAYVRKTTPAAERPVVFTMMTPVVWVALGGDVDLRFLSGTAQGLRAQRYVLWRPTGPVDWWIGDPALPSVEMLCDALRAAPGAAVIFDGFRLSAPDDYYGFVGPYADVIRGTTKIAYQRPHVATVSRVKPVSEWSATATKLCRSHAPDPDEGGGWLTED